LICRRWRNRAFAVVALVGSSSLPALAQDRVRDGVIVSTGLGVGTSDATGTACVDIGNGSCSRRDAPRRNAPAGYLRIGVAVRPNFVLGGEVNGWYRREDRTSGPSLGILTANAIAQWYPRVSNGFFVSGGLGVGTWRSNSEFIWSAQGAVRQMYSVHLHTNGLGYQFGAGYDVHVSRNLSVAPYVTLFGARDNGEEGAAFGGNVIQAGIGLTWH
jgi:hypothetical protein